MGPTCVKWYKARSQALPEYILHMLNMNLPKKIWKNNAGPARPGLIIMGRAWECLGPTHEHPIHSFEILLDTNTLKFNKQTHCTLILKSQKLNFDQTNAQIKANKVKNQTSKIANFTLDLSFCLGKMVGQQGEAKLSCGFSRTVHCAPQIGGSIRCLRDPDISLVLETTSPCQLPQMSLAY